MRFCLTKGSPFSLKSALQQSFSALNWSFISKNAYFANFTYILRHFLLTFSQICLKKGSDSRRWHALSKGGVWNPEMAHPCTKIGEEPPLGIFHGMYNPERAQVSNWMWVYANSSTPAAWVWCKVYSSYATLTATGYATYSAKGVHPCCRCSTSAFSCTLEVAVGNCPSLQPIQFNKDWFLHRIISMLLPILVVDTHDSILQQLKSSIRMFQLILPIILFAILSRFCYDHSIHVDKWYLLICLDESIWSRTVYRDVINSQRQSNIFRGICISYW